MMAAACTDTEESFENISTDEKWRAAAGRGLACAEAAAFSGFTGRPI